ncbi:MAG: Na+/H+ antiporter NhaA [Tatlockia sp.]|nr:Na+/H+ antiporter NhaA [Tatlockia sp.]
MSRATSFYNLETLGGILLFIAAMLAILVANSPYRLHYEHFLHLHASISVGTLVLEKSLMHWINDGLMAIYFMLIGLEIKREVNRGILSNKKDLLVPAVTAVCGLVIPALIFVFINAHNPVFLKGWAIPTATDIAFSLGIVSLLGSRVPFGLKVLLTAIAIFDDIAAIGIIALFYTSNLSLISLILALLFTLILIGLNFFQCRRLSLFMFFGIALWIAVLQSGVHATLAGIVIAMTIPDEEKQSLLAGLENSLHPWVVFFILPLFAFANAGVSFIGIDTSLFTHPVFLGIALGLFLGKQTGIFLSLGYFVKYKQLLRKENISLSQVYGIALICGVGFTMSLFIGSLAYQNVEANLMPMVKMGVLLGSLLSGIGGFLVLKKPRLRN